jgi:hypothetical protein
MYSKLNEAQSPTWQGDAFIEKEIQILQQRESNARKNVKCEEPTQFIISAEFQCKQCKIACHRIIA